MLVITPELGQNIPKEEATKGAKSRFHYIWCRRAQNIVQSWRRDTEISNSTPTFLYYRVSAPVVKSENTRAFATRLPISEAELLEAAVKETDLTRAVVVRRAIEYYLKENPDRIRVLFPEDSLDQLMTEMLE